MTAPGVAVDLRAVLGPDWQSLEWRLDNLYWIVNKDGRKTRFVMNDAQREFVRNIWYRNIILKSRQRGFCLDPETRVLMADLTWRQIGSVRPGQEVVAVDESPPGGRGLSRKLRTATVQATRRVIGDAYRITFDDGRSVVCTGKHRWLSRKTMTQAEWRMVDDGRARLTVGTLVRWITRPWDEPTVEDGWFGGMLDGEGSIGKANRSGAAINVCQVAGPVWDRLLRYGTERGYACRVQEDGAARRSKHGSRPVPKLCFTRMDEMFRLIGQTRPTRFVGRRWWEGKDMPGKRSGEGWAAITAIEKLPDQEMVDLQTTCGTFIAEGFVSHNSTLLQLMQLDQALFNADHNGVVISDTLPNAGKLFGKIEYAWDHLAPAIKTAIDVKSRTSRTGIAFGHGSEVSVSTSSRGGTVQFLHVSELGKIARKYPERAAEIVTGAFESVPVEGCITVESTAEGMAGEFWDLCEPAMKRAAEKATETRLDWRLHFFPWFTDTDCRLPEHEAVSVQIPDKFARYFREQEAHLGVRFDVCQRAWYVKKAETLGSKMKQEYPSTPEEAFEQAIEGAVYGEQMTWLREQGRLMAVPIDPAHPVHTFWDMGKRDKTAIWFMQHVLGQFRWVRYREDSNKDLRYYWREVLEDWRREHKLAWGRHFLPHDAATERLGAINTTMQQELAGLGMEDSVIVPAISELAIGIDITRKALTGPHYFDKTECAEGIRCLDGYQYEWDDKLGVWGRLPLHNWASHGSDAWRMHAQGWEALGAANEASFRAFKTRNRSWR